MEKKKVRRKYTQEFRDDVVRLVLDEGLSVVQVSKDLCIGTGSLYQWVKFARDEGYRPKEMDKTAELVWMKNRIRVLAEEREILTNATAFFAKETK